MNGSKKIEAPYTIEIKDENVFYIQVKLLQKELESYNAFRMKYLKMLDPPFLGGSRQLNPEKYLLMTLCAFKKSERLIFLCYNYLLSSCPKNINPERAIINISDSREADM